MSSKTLHVPRGTVADIYDRFYLAPMNKVLPEGDFDVGRILRYNCQERERLSLPSQHKSLLRLGSVKRGLPQLGQVWLGSVWLGLARPGLARAGPIRLGSAQLGVPGMPYRVARLASRLAFSLPGSGPEVIAYHLRRVSPSRPAAGGIWNLA